MITSAVETVAQQFMFPTSDAPRFQKTKGYAFGIGWIVVMIVWLCVILPVSERYFKRNRPQHFQEPSYGSD